MRQSIRVLHVQHSLDPGGMENGVVNVAGILGVRGFDIHVCCLEKSGSFAARLPNPANVHVLAKGPGFSLRAAWRLFRLIRRIRPDVVHTHNLGALIYGALATLGGRLRPVLHGEHGQPDEGPEGQRRLRQRKRLFRAAARVHTVSHGLRDYFVRQGFDESSVVALVNGVDTERFAPADRAAARLALEISDRARVVVIVGRLIASKGHQLLFTAFESLVDSVPEALLLVVGAGGSDEEAIRAAAEASPVAKHIRLEGFQSDPTPYYAAADILVAPSTIEGLSNVVLEAMACGLPALVHEACGNREVITHGDDGLLADLSTVGSLAENLVQCLRDPARLEEIGRKARATVRDRFSLAAMAEAYENTYRSLAQGKS